MRSHIAAYRFLLSFYPAKFRHAYGDEMTRLFTDLLAAQRQSGQRFSTLRLWSRTLVDTISSSIRERLERNMFSQTGMTRALLIAFPIGAFAAMGMLGTYAGLAVLVVGIIVLSARRRTLPNALIGTGHGRWWVWTLAGLAIVGTSMALATLSSDESGDTGELGWLLWSLLFFAGALIVAVSVVRAIALAIARRSTPPA